MPPRSPAPLRSTHQSYSVACFPVLLLILLASLGVRPVGAADLVITEGYLDRTPSSGPLVMKGERGFSFTGNPGNGLFPILNECNAGDAPCGPGDRISLLGAWSSLDLPGSATLDGVGYPKVGDIASLSVEFSGSLTLPAFRASATVSAPFTFAGRFSYPNGRESLVGGGIVTVMLVPHNLPGRWRVTRVLYEFGARLPSPWVSTDIGAVGTPGRASLLNDTFTIAGDGADVWGTGDAFRLTYKPLSGLGEVSARVVRAEKVWPVPSYAAAIPNGYAKAGVMIRDAIDSGSRSVILDMKPNGELELMARYAPSEPTSYIAGALTAGTDVWLQLARRNGGEVTASYSTDGRTWSLLATISIDLAADALGGLAVTSHDAGALYAALFDNVTVGTLQDLPNLLTRGGFEEYDPPALGPPGWISDDALRQVPAKSETHQPRSGEKNGACWTTGYFDCGIYQEVNAPWSGRYSLRVYATADRSGGLVGANVNGATAATREVDVRSFDDYALYTMEFTATAGDLIRVWMYSPPVPGYVVIDDASLMPVAVPMVREITSGSWTIDGAPFGAFTLQGADFTLQGTYEYGDVEPLTSCRNGCLAPITIGLRSVFANDTPSTIMTFARGSATIGGYTYLPFVEFTGAVTLNGGLVMLPQPTSTSYPFLVTASAPFTLSGTLKGYKVSGVFEPHLQFELPLHGTGTATVEMLAGPGSSGATLLQFYRLHYDFGPE